MGKTVRYGYRVIHLISSFALMESSVGWPVIPMGRSVAQPMEARHWEGIADFETDGGSEHILDLFFLDDKTGWALVNLVGRIF